MSKQLQAALCLIFSILPFFSNGQLSNKTKAQLHQSAKESLPDFIDFLSLPNDAYQPEQLEANIQWAETAFGDLGFKTQRIPTKGIDLLFAERQFKKAQKTILFYVQIDGQPVDPRTWFQDSPFKPVVKKQNENGDWEIIPSELLKGDLNPEWRIFARSASDAKGPILMLIAALKVMEKNQDYPNYNIKIILDTEEEIGSPNLPAAVLANQALLMADGLVILDGPMHPSNQPTLTFGARGITTLRLTTYGPKVPQHSGHYGNYVPNPALHLTQLLASMKDYEGKVLIPGYYDGIKIDKKTQVILQAVPDDEKSMQEQIGFAVPDKVAGTLQEALQYPSLNIRGLQSAWVGNKVRTIIPHAAVANIDIRTVLESDPERLVQLIRKHIEDQGFHFCEQEPTDEERSKYPRLVSMSYKIAYQAFRTDLNSRLGLWLEAAQKSAFNKDPIKIRTFGGSIPISPFVNTLNIPAVIVPLVNPDNNQHSPNENIRIGSYLNGVISCYAILTEDI